MKYDSAPIANIMNGVYKKPASNIEIANSARELLGCVLNYSELLRVVVPGQGNTAVSTTGDPLDTENWVRVEVHEEIRSEPCIVIINCVDGVVGLGLRVPVHFDHGQNKFVGPYGADAVSILAGEVRNRILSRVRRLTQTDQ